MSKSNNNSIVSNVRYSTIPWEAIEDTDMSSSAFRVFCYLLRRTNSEHRAFPSHRTISSDIGVSRSTVVAAIEQLRALGWIKVYGVDSETTGHKQRHVYVVFGSRQTGTETRPVQKSDRSENQSGTGIEIVPNRSENQSITNTSELTPELTPSGRPRDLLWESFVAVHGDPATDSERGKFNAAVKKLKQAGVTGDEYPRLVMAFTSKHDGLQPSVMTIANDRVTEMRQFLKKGPVKSVSLDALADEVWARELDARQALEAK